MSCGYSVVIGSSKMTLNQENELFYQSSRYYPLKDVMPSDGEYLVNEY